MDGRGAVPGPEQAPIEMEMGDDEKSEDIGEMVEVKRREKGERGKADGKQKDCFAFSGGGGGSSNESEEQERQRQIEQWNLKRPGIMEAHLEAGKRQRNT